VTYKWRADNSDAELLGTNLSEAIVIKTATGTRTQTWYYPSRQDCLVCHTAKAGLVLGVKTRQMNRDFEYPSGRADNQLRAWNRMGLFEGKLEEGDIPKYASLARGDDSGRSLEERARSYLDANCAYCHRPGGTVANFDARYDTPLKQQNLIGGQILLDEGIDGARAIAPNDIWRSLIYARASSLDAIKMPQLARNTVDESGMRLLREWIESMPGPPVLAPPEVSPAQGHYDQPVEVTLKEAEPGASIRYTLDGSLPTSADALYEKPIRLSGSAILRAKAFKAGFTKSITVQQVYVVGE
jgi:mono/diheme cytochrome c family protein